MILGCGVETDTIIRVIRAQGDNADTDGCSVTDQVTPGEGNLVSG